MGSVEEDSSRNLEEALVQVQFSFSFFRFVNPPQLCLIYSFVN